MRLTIPALILLAACTEVATGPADDCGASSLSDYVGQPAEALPPRAGPVRMIPPGSAVTMDYFAGRLNVDLDEDGTITRLWCG